MDDYTKLDSIDFSLKNNVLNYIIFKVSKIAIEAPNEDIKNIVVQVFTINKEKKKAFRKFNFEQLEIRDIISPFVQFIEESCENSNNLSTITEAFVTHKQLINDFYRDHKNESDLVQNLILRIMAIILKSEIKENQNTNKLGQLGNIETAPITLNEENKKQRVAFSQVHHEEINKVLVEIKKLTGPDSPNFLIKVLIISCGMVILIALLGFHLKSKKDTEFLMLAMNGGKSNGDESKESQGYNKGDIGILKKQINELFNPVLKELVDINKIITDSSKDLSKSLSKKLDDKIDEIKQAPMVEIKLDGVVIKKVFDSVIKDEKSEFGKAILKINGIGDKKPVDTVDTTSDKNKKELVDLVKNKDRLEKENKGLSDKILEVSTSVSNLKDEVKNKTKEIDKLEAKIKSIGDEKTGFKGLTGSFAILFTNSKDFPLNNSILSTAFTLIEKQPKDQKFGVYIATGNQIAANLDLRDNKEKSMNLISPTGSPTEMLSDAGQAFLDYAFDGKNPIPIPDRKAIIIATWSAEAPKSNSSGWKDISQVDAILIQPANVQQIRYAKSWLDFVNQKNGRLLLISGPDNFDAGSDNLKQLSKQISTLLNTKKD